MTNDHPLGTPNLTAPSPAVGVGSIVDSILDLDGFLSGDVRRAEDYARFCTKPHLQAKLTALEGQLATLVDENGAPRGGAAAEESLSESSPVEDLVTQVEAVEAEMAGSMKSVLMRQVPEPEWRAFLNKHQKAFDSVATGTLPSAVYEDLITMSAVKPTFTVDQLTRFRDRIGIAAVDELAVTAWKVNQNAGVSVPKSLRSSAVRRRQRLSSS